MAKASDGLDGCESLRSYEDLTRLELDGSELTKPAEVVITLYILSHRDAETVVKVTNAAGYRELVDAPPGKQASVTIENRFRALSGAREVSSPQDIRRMRRYFKGIAKRLGKEYSGWGADIVK